MWGEGLAENIVWGMSWLKTSEYRHLGRGRKLLKKPSYDIWTFPYHKKRWHNYDCLCKLNCNLDNQL